MKRFLYVTMSLVLLIGMLPVSYSTNAAPTSSSDSSAIFFAADGMRPDLMEKYAGEGDMPTYADLMAHGVTGANGMVQAFPPNTGVGWYTLATGNYPSEHGSTNNTFHRTGEVNFNTRTAAFSGGVLQADTIAEAVERAGKKVVSMEWAGGSRTATKLQGPVVDYRNFYSGRGLWTNWDVPGQPAGANAFFVQYQRNDLVDAAGWTNVPTSYSPAKAGTFDITSNTTGDPPVPVIANDQYDFFVYDSTNDAAMNYDKVLIVPNAAAKDGSQAVADLKAGEWADVKVVLANPAGKTGGFYVKAQRLAPDLSQVSIFFSSVARSVATCTGCGYVGDFEDDLNRLFPSSTAADYAIFESGLVDADTYIEQGLAWKNAHFAYLRFILGTGPVATVDGGSVPGLGYDPDLLMLGAPTVDEFSHMFLGLTVPSVNGLANPYYNTYMSYGEVITPEIADGFLRVAYSEADATLALGKELMGGTPNIVAASDHGFGAQWLAVNAGKVLADEDIQHNGDGTEVFSNCRAATGTGNLNLAKACWAGGTAQIYVNTSLPTGVKYEDVRTAVINAFLGLTDPANPGADVVLKIMKKEELRNVDGSDSLHPSRSGDVVVVLKPPYQFDAATFGQTIAFSQFFGQHGFLPETVDLASGVNMHATFVAAGPGIRHQGPVAGIRAIDLAPTISFLLDVPGPINARGKILYDLLPVPGQYKEATILSLSDYHGRITPESEAADNLAFPAVNPSFGISGAAFLKPWIDLYRAEARDGSIFVTAGDSTGATQPISNFFGDLPTIDALNMMALSADTFGNHSFDYGSEYLRTVLIPASDYPYLASNVVFQTSGLFPPEWKAYQVFNFDGFKLGVIGYTLPELASLIFPGYLDPFEVTDPVDAVNAAATAIRSKSKVNAVIAVGHLGADGGTVTSPDPLISPLLDFTDGLTGVDAVIGGHTHRQYITSTNGVLVVENMNYGQRFTRIRLVIDTNTKAVVYKTADFHKPWNIGVTPDPDIQAMINALNAELAPILTPVVGYSTKEILRSDSCGRFDGRTCESLIGDVTADALRLTYSTDIGITNSGGLRANLTCPTTDIPTDFCPASLYPFADGKFPITRGQVLGVLPFGNQVVKVQVSGAELKSMLENGVSLMPSAQGRFPQVSGLCFTYDIALSADSRVTGAVFQAADGTCTGTAIDLTPGTTMYWITENDFMATGGDGYKNFYSLGRVFTLDYMDVVLAGYLEQYNTPNPPIDPDIQGRITCTDSNGATTPNCPAPPP